MIEDVSNQLFIQFTKALSAKFEGNKINEATDTQEENTLSGVAVASAAIKGMSERLMDKLK